MKYPRKIRERENRIRRANFILSGKNQSLRLTYLGGSDKILFDKFSFIKNNILSELFMDRKDGVNCRLIFTICWTVYSLVYTARLNLSVAAPQLGADGTVNAAEISVMSGLFFFSYAFGQIINGRAGDRFNPKNVLSIGLLLSGFSNLGVGLAVSFFTSPVLLTVLWTVNGYAQSMLWGPILRIVSVVFTDEKRKTATMALSVSVAVSNILGYALPMLFLSAAGLPGAFIIPGTVSLVSAAAVMIFMRRVSPPRQKTTRVSLIRLGLDRRTRVFLLPAFLHGIIKDNLALWMPLLFSTLYGGLSGILTVMYILMSPIMMLVGRLIYPLIYRLLFRDERYVCIVSFSVIVSALIPLAAADVSAPVTAVVFCIVSMCISVINGTLLSVFPLRFAEENCVSSAAGLMDFVTYIGAAVSMFALGGFMDRPGGHTVLIAVWLACAALSVVLLGVFAAISRKKDKSGLQQ
jgi:MFS transporter